MKESDFEKEFELDVEDTERSDKLFDDLDDFPQSIKDIKNKKHRRKKAERIPERIDTLREDFNCPVDLGAQCGLVINSNDDVCDVCGYVKRPEGFDDPDLTRRKRIKEREKRRERVESSRVPALNWRPV